MSPFDVEAEEADDVTKQFWGSSPGWVPRRRPSIDDVSGANDFDEGRSDDTTGSLQVIREGVRAFRPRRVVRSTGQVARTRRHRMVADRPAPIEDAPTYRQASLGELAAGGHDDDVDVSFVAGQPTQPLATIEHETDLVQLSPTEPSAGIDPLLARVGILIVVGLLLVPVALVMRSGSDQTSADTLTVGEATAAAPLDSAATATTPSVPATSPVLPAGESASESQPAPETAPSDAADAAASPVADDQVATTSEAAGDEVQVVASSDGGVATVSAAAERVVPACPATYVAGAGDSWYRIADAAGVSPTALLDENLATVDTVIFPGDDICLPAGATMPTQPTTTTLEPAPESTAPATTAPATTAPPTTQPPAPASTAEVQQIIRDVWPDELEEKALQVAWRESNYKPNVYNGWCCYGVFQIYWSVHVSWLDEYGINSSNDLLDARKNITAAYALYQRAGGWGPWGG